MNIKISYFVTDDGLRPAFENYIYQHYNSPSFNPTLQFSDHYKSLPISRIICLMSDNNFKQGSWNAIVEYTYQNEDSKREIIIFDVPAVKFMTLIMDT